MENTSVSAQEDRSVRNGIKVWLSRICVPDPALHRALLSIHSNAKTYSLSKSTWHLSVFAELELETIVILSKAIRSDQHYNCFSA